MNLGIGVNLTTTYQPIPAVALDPDAAIAALFGSGEVGAWYDPSDSSTVWQDAAGTTPATVGDPVGRIDDKSGNGNHATQTTSAARPVLQQSGGLYYLDFDGVDDSLKTSTINPASDKAQLFVGIEKTVDTGCMVFELGVTTNNQGVLAFLAPSTAPANKYEAISRGDVGLALVQETDAAFAAPITNVASIINDISGSSLQLRLDGVVEATSTATQGTINHRTDIVYLGARAGTSLFFSGNIYGLVVRFGNNLSAQQIDDAETYLAAKSGVTL